MNLTLLQEKLPAHLVEIAKGYIIPDAFLQNDADLVVLVLESKSLNTHDEKQNWFNLYNIMNAEQIQKLRDILTKEKEKLAEIEAKYKAKHEEIVKKYEQAYTASYEKNQQMQQAAVTAQQKDAAEADDLLNLI